jgi:hypothetical protein
MASVARFVLLPFWLLGFGPLSPAPAAGAGLTEVTYQITGGSFTIDRQEVIATGGTVRFRHDTYTPFRVTLLTFEVTGTSNRLKLANARGKLGLIDGRNLTFLFAFTSVLTGPALSQRDGFRVREARGFLGSTAAHFDFYLGSYDADRVALIDVTGVEVSRVSEPLTAPALAAALGVLLVALGGGAGLLRRTGP